VLIDTTRIPGRVVAPFAALRGTLRCSVCAGSCSNSAYGIRQSRALIRPALRYSPTPHGVGAVSRADIGA